MVLQINWIHISFKNLTCIRLIKTTIHLLQYFIPKLTNTAGCSNSYGNMLYGTLNSTIYRALQVEQIIYHKKITKIYISLEAGNNINCSVCGCQQKAIDRNYFHWNWDLYRYLTDHPIQTLTNLKIFKFFYDIFLCWVVIEVWSVAETIKKIGSNLSNVWTLR